MSIRSSKKKCSVLKRRWAFIFFLICSLPQSMTGRFSLGQNILLSFIRSVLWLIAFSYIHIKNWNCFRKQRSTSLVNCLSFLKLSIFLTLSFLCIFWCNRATEVIGCLRLYDEYCRPLKRMPCRTAKSTHFIQKMNMCVCGGESFKCS